MAAPLKLIQLNIEHGKHLERTLPFLREHAPDVVCLQELNEDLMPEFEKTLQASGVFEPMCLYQGKVQGIGIFSKYLIVRQKAIRYGGSSEKLPAYDNTSFETKHDSLRFSLLVADIEKEGELFRIGTTHFPVTEHGKATDFQRKDMQNLLSILREQGELVFTGDFNAPRGGEIFSKLAAEYRDTVPPQYKTSLDIALHRNGKEFPHELADKMVDGIFSTPGYMVSDVALIHGVSDHCAIVATVAKV